MEERSLLSELEVIKIATSLEKLIDKGLDLSPTFNGRSGWLSIAELNAIDPEANRFDVREEFTCEDGTVFVLIQQC